MRRLAVVTVLILFLGIAVVAVRSSNNRVAAAARVPTNRLVTFQPLDHSKHPIPIVDGAVTPNAIPDDVAFRMLFRTLLSFDRIDNRSRTYVNLLLAGAEIAPDEKVKLSTQLLDIIDQYRPRYRRVRAQQVNASAEKQLSELANGKVLESELFGEMRRHILSSADARLAGQIQMHIQERLKRRIRVFSR